MKIELASDTMTPDLLERMRRVEDMSPAMEQMGKKMVEWAMGSWRKPGNRPTEWPPLKDETVAAKTRRSKKTRTGKAIKNWSPRMVPMMLMQTGQLQRSSFVAGFDSKSVTVANNRPAGNWSLAEIHQKGAPKAKIPAPRCAIWNRNSPSA